MRMKELNAFERFGEISDQYVTEAIIPSAKLLSLKKKTFSDSALGRFINSSWGVAILCAVVSLGIVAGILAAGHMDPPFGPPAHTTESGETDQTDRGTDTDGAESMPPKELSHPTIQKNTYNESVVILYDQKNLPGEYLYAEDHASRDDLLSESLYTRVKQTEDYLGVDIVFQACTDSGDIDTTLWELKASGDYMAHLVMTSGEALAEQHHVLTNFETLDMMDLDATYWDGEMMSTHTIDGGIYFGKNSFIPPNAYLLAYNKLLYQSAGINKDLYGLVSRQEWTLDTMMAIATEATGCAYGFAVRGSQPLRAFQTACELFVLDTVETPDGLTQDYVYGDNFTKAEQLFNLMRPFFTSKRVTASPFTGMGTSISDGNVLFEPMQSVEFLHCQGDMELGVLPIPKYDQAQTAYVSLYLGGYLGIFAHEDHVRMCGETAELLAFASADMPTVYDKAYLGMNTAKVTPKQQLDLDMMKIIHAAQTDLGMVSLKYTDMGLHMGQKWIEGEPNFASSFNHLQRSNQMKKMLHACGFN